MGKFDTLFKLNKMAFKMFGLALYIKRFPLLLSSLSDRNNNRSLGTIRKNDKCFIIGLGPSLSEIDLKKLDGDVIVTNRFYKVEEAASVTPTAYVIIDNFFYTGKYKDDLLKAIDSFSNTYFIFNGTYRNKIDKAVLDGINHSFIYLWNGFLNGEKSKIDCSKVLPIASNVICAAEYLALYMGYKEINLLGCDFNSFASQKQIHAYKDDQKERLWTMSNELFQYSFAADLHCQLDTYSKLHDQRIYNLTEGSLIDAYERRSCEKYKK